MAKKQSDKIAKRIGFGVLGLGLFFIAVSVYQLIITTSFVMRTSPIIGEVIGMETGYTVSTRAEDTYQPLFAYTDGEGNFLQGQSAYLSMTYNFPIGTKVAIRVDPDVPGKVYVDEATNLWGFTIIFGGLGALFGVLGAKHLHNIKKYGGKKRKKAKT
ncbi:hypothetical protein MNBD_ALPHA11-1396 [hydrothermal vent metagenome]|uniref:DUF3592 domain-containing protein n=1 Tax=hydrothermal vent metagenome TaxID=652676 RepID=A0A3B0U5M3_9ZZZZ